MLGKRDYSSEKACGKDSSFFAAGESVAVCSDTLAVKQVLVAYRFGRDMVNRRRFLFQSRLEFSRNL